MMGRRSGVGVFFIFLIGGLYFLNLAFNFFPLPATILANKTYAQVSNFIAGVLILVGGFKFLLSRRSMY